ncbi:MAG: hypothetical protein ACON5A_01715 [Candidatus Comchoanobacterales bacterium]
MHDGTRKRPIDLIFNLTGSHTDAPAVEKINVAIASLFKLSHLNMDHQHLNLLIQNLLNISTKLSNNILNEKLMKSYLQLLESKGLYYFDRMPKTNKHETQQTIIAERDACLRKLRHELKRPIYWNNENRIDKNGSYLFIKEKWAWAVNNDDEVLIFNNTIDKDFDFHTLKKALRNIDLVTLKHDQVITLLPKRRHDAKIFGLPFYEEWSKMRDDFIDKHLNKSLLCDLLHCSSNAVVYFHSRIDDYLHFLSGKLLRQYQLEKKEKKIRYEDEIYIIDPENTLKFEQMCLKNYKHTPVQLKYLMMNKPNGFFSGHYSKPAIAYRNLDSGYEETVNELPYWKEWEFKCHYAMYLEFIEQKLNQDIIDDQLKKESNSEKRKKILNQKITEKDREKYFKEKHPKYGFYLRKCFLDLRDLKDHYTLHDSRGVALSEVFKHPFKFTCRQYGNDKPLPFSDEWSKYLENNGGFISSEDKRKINFQKNLLQTLKECINQLGSVLPDPIVSHLSWMKNHKIAEHFFSAQKSEVAHKQLSHLLRFHARYYIYNHILSTNHDDGESEPTNGLIAYGVKHDLFNQKCFHDMVWDYSKYIFQSKDFKEYIRHINSIASLNEKLNFDCIKTLLEDFQNPILRSVYTTITSHIPKYKLDADLNIVLNDDLDPNAETAAKIKANIDLTIVLYDDLDPNGETAAKMKAVKLMPALLPKKPPKSNTYGETLVISRVESLLLMQYGESRTETLNAFILRDICEHLTVTEADFKANLLNGDTYLQLYTYGYDNHCKKIKTLENEIKTWEKELYRSNQLKAAAEQHPEQIKKNVFNDRIQELNNQIREVSRKIEKCKDNTYMAQKQQKQQDLKNCTNETEREKINFEIIDLNTIIQDYEANILNNTIEGLEKQKNNIIKNGMAHKDLLSYHMRQCKAAKREAESNIKELKERKSKEEQKWSSLTDNINSFVKYLGFTIILKNDIETLKTKPSEANQMVEKLIPYFHNPESLLEFNNFSTYLDYVDTEEKTIRAWLKYAKDCIRGENLIARRLNSSNFNMKLISHKRVRQDILSNLLKFGKDAFNQDTLPVIDKVELGKSASIKNLLETAVNQLSSKSLLTLISLEERNIELPHFYDWMISDKEIISDDASKDVHWKHYVNYLICGGNANAADLIDAEPYAFILALLKHPYLLTNTHPSPKVPIYDEDTGETKRVPLPKIQAWRKQKNILEHKDVTRTAMAIAAKSMIDINSEFSNTKDELPITKNQVLIDKYPIYNMKLLEQIDKDSIQMFTAKYIPDAYEKAKGKQETEVKQDSESQKKLATQLLDNLRFDLSIQHDFSYDGKQTERYLPVKLNQYYDFIKEDILVIIQDIISLLGKANHEWCQRFFHWLCASPRKIQIKFFKEAIDAIKPDGVKANGDDNPNLILCNKLQSLLNFISPEDSSLDEEEPTISAFTKHCYNYLKVTSQLRYNFNRYCLPSELKKKHIDYFNSKTFSYENFNSEERPISFFSHPVSIKSLSLKPQHQRIISANIFYTINRIGFDLYSKKLDLSFQESPHYSCNIDVFETIEKLLQQTPDMNTMDLPEILQDYRTYCNVENGDLFNDKITHDLSRTPAQMFEGVIVESTENHRRNEQLFQSYEIDFWNDSRKYLELKDKSNNEDDKGSSRCFDSVTSWNRPIL